MTSPSCTAAWPASRRAFAPSAERPETRLDTRRAEAAAVANARIENCARATARMARGRDASGAPPALYTAFASRIATRRLSAASAPAGSTARPVSMASPGAARTAVSGADAAPLPIGVGSPDGTQHRDLGHSGWTCRMETTGGGAEWWGRRLSAKLPESTAYVDVTDAGAPANSPALALVETTRTGARAGRATMASKRASAAGSWCWDCCESAA